MATCMPIAAIVTTRLGLFEQVHASPEMKGKNGPILQFAFYLDRLLTQLEQRRENQDEFESKGAAGVAGAPGSGQRNAATRCEFAGPGRADFGDDQAVHYCAV